MRKYLDWQAVIQSNALIVLTYDQQQIGSD